MDTPEMSERAKQLALYLDSLALLLEAHAGPHLRQTIVAIFREEKIDDEELDAYISMYRMELQDRGYEPEKIETTVAEARRTLLAVSNNEPKDMDLICAMALAEGIPLIVEAWLTALCEASLVTQGVRLCYARLLGDDLLPVDDEEANLRFNNAFPPACAIDAKMAREILRLVRAAQPPGTVLPPDAVKAIDIVASVVYVP